MMFFKDNAFFKDSQPIKWKMMYVLARAAITKFHTLGAWNDGNLFSPSSGGWKPEREVLAGLPFRRPLSLAYRRSSYSRVFTCSLLCTSPVSPCVLVSSSDKDNSQTGLEPTQQPHFNLITSVKSLPAKTVTF